MSNSNTHPFIPTQAPDNGAQRGATNIPSSVGLDEEVAQRILRSVGSLKYGSVEVTVHDGRVVQIDRRERVRIDPNRK
jgi:hypothetical protein